MYCSPSRKREGAGGRVWCLAEVIACGLPSPIPSRLREGRVFGERHALS
ncbi:hypothetical protein ABIC44_003379 [Sphingomonas sp. 1185]